MLDLYNISEELFQAAQKLKLSNVELRKAAPIYIIGEQSERISFALKKLKERFAEDSFLLKNSVYFAEFTLFPDLHGNLVFFDGYGNRFNKLEEIFKNIYVSKRAEDSFILINVNSSAVSSAFYEEWEKVLESIERNRTRGFYFLTAEEKFLNELKKIAERTIFCKVIDNIGTSADELSEYCTEVLDIYGITYNKQNAHQIFSNFFGKHEKLGIKFAELMIKKLVWNIGISSETADNIIDEFMIKIESDTNRSENEKIGF